MKELKAGDVVLITDSQKDFFDAGTKAVLTRFDGLDWWACFSGLGNPSGSYKMYPDGEAEWCIGIPGKRFVLADVHPSSYYTKEIVSNAKARASIKAAGQVLQSFSHGLAAECGWWTDGETGQDVRTWPGKFFKLWVGTKLALIHSEVSEALEGHRKNLPDDKLPQYPMLAVELADAVIRAFDLSGGLGFDLGAIIADKLAFNSSREDHKPENRVKDGGKAY